MKKLNKLQINPEKLIKNQELTTLRGGYDCGMGYQHYYCEIIYEPGCSSTYGDACIPWGVGDANYWVTQNLPCAWASCSPVG